MAEQSVDRRQALNIVRLTLLGGTVVFAPIAWGVAGEVSPPLDSDLMFYLSAGLLLFFLVLFAGILVARSRWQAAHSFQKKRSASIIGWALAQSAALLGGIFLMFGGSAAFLGAGFALQLLASYVFLPVPEP